MVVCTTYLPHQIRDEKLQYLKEQARLYFQVPTDRPPSCRQARKRGRVGPDRQWAACLLVLVLVVVGPEEQGAPGAAGASTHGQQAPRTTHQHRTTLLPSAAEPSSSGSQQ